MTIRAALVISFLFHALIVAPISGIVASKSVSDEKQVAVEYIVVKEPEAKKPIPEALIKDEAPRLELVKNIGLKRLPTVKNVNPPHKISANLKLSNDARNEAQIKTTKDYINYYELLREKIRQRLKDNYRNYHHEGDVILNFVLNRYGTVETIDIDMSKSTHNGSLQNVAVSSVREASPYPEFPSALNLPRMSFSLQVTFKKK